MNKLFIFLLIFLSLNLFAKKQEENSMFIKKGNRGMSHFGITKFSFDKVGINLGGDYLFHIDDDLFIGFSLDSNLLKFKYLEQTALVDLTVIGVNGYFEFYSEKDSSFDGFLGAGLMVLGIFSWDDYFFTPFLGLSYNYKKFFVRAKYTFLGMQNSGSDYAVSISFGFLLDLRPKKLNKGYYNDEF